MIKIVKLVSGEEIVADVTLSGNEYKLEKPCVLQMVPSRANPEQPMMGMFPYATYAEGQTVTIKAEHIVWDAKPVTELYNQYNSAFGSGIQLAGL